MAWLINNKIVHYDKTRDYDFMDPFDDPEVTKNLNPEFLDFGKTLSTLMEQAKEIQAVTDSGMIAKVDNSILRNLSLDILCFTDAKHFEIQGEAQWGTGQWASLVICYLTHSAVNIERYLPNRTRYTRFRKSEVDHDFLFGSNVREIRTDIGRFVLLTKEDADEVENTRAAGLRKNNATNGDTGKRISTRDEPTQGSLFNIH